MYLIQIKLLLYGKKFFSLFFETGVGIVGGNIETMSLLYRRGPHKIK
jgi:hypothetical protein